MVYSWACLTPMEVWKLEVGELFRSSQWGSTHCYQWGTRDHKCSSTCETILCTKTCPIPNPNYYLTSAKSPIAQNVLFPISSEGKFPLICSIHPAISTCFTVAGPALGKTSCTGCLAYSSCRISNLLLILACIYSSNIPTSFWVLATLVSLWSTKICFL